MGQSTPQTLEGGAIYAPTLESGQTSININPLIISTTGGPVTLNIPAGVTVNINGINGSSTTGGQPAICVPVGATLILTGEGVLNLKGGNAGNSTDGANGEPGSSGKFNVNNYGGPGGAGGNGGGGAAPAIGGIGGTGGNGGASAGKTDDGLWGSSSIVTLSGNPGENGQDGSSMGTVYILGTLEVNVTNGANTGNGNKGNNYTYASQSDIPVHDVFGFGKTYYHGGSGGNGGSGGSAPTYAIGGGAGGGGGGGAGNSGIITRDYNQVSIFGNASSGANGINGNNGNLFIQETANVNYYNSDGNEGIPRPDVNTIPPTRIGYTFYGYKIGDTWTFDANGSIKDGVTSYSGSISEYWVANEYTVTLDNQSGTGGTNSVTATYDSAMPSASAPTRSGYIFRGYYTEPDGGGTKYYNADMTSANDWDIADNQTLYAKWILPSFTITLDADGGSDGTSSVTVTFGSDMPSATAPTKANYTFMGYFTAENGAGTQYYYPDMSSKRVWDDDTGLINTLYAYWADCHTDKTIKVSYDSNGGYGTMEPQLVRLADNIKANIFIKGDATTHKQNYFSGWNTKADGTGRGYQPGDVIFATEEYSEITLYAQWDPTFKDIYVIATADDLLDFATQVNGGDMSRKGILAADIDMSGKIWTPIGTYYVPFQGIFNGNGYIVSNLTMADNASYDYAGLFGYAKNATIQNVIAKNVTLYAKYPMGAVCGRIDSEMSHATGGFLTRCGSFGTFNYNYRPTTPSQGESGGLATAETTYFKKGEISYVWSTNTAVGYVIGYLTDKSLRILENVNYRSSEASRTNGTLCHDGMNEGVSGSTSWTQTFGVDECPRPTNRGRAVYKEVVNATTKFYNIYNVYFISNGGTSTACSDTQVKKYSDGTNNGLSLPTTTREGYTFQGWYTEMEGGIPVSEALSSISADLILYAHWTVKKCTVILDADAVVTTPGTASVNNVTYDQPMPTPEGLTAPTRTGYTFGGYYIGHNGSGTQYYTESMTSATNWLEDTESETTLYAKWTANQYTVSFNARGGSPSPGDITVTYDAEYGTLSTPTRYGFTFDGWYTGETNGTQVESSTIVQITDNQTLYAHWNPITTDYDSYSVIGDPRLRGNYFRSFYDSHVAYELPDGVTAYKGQADGQYLVLTKIEVTDNNKNILPKDVPVILVAEPSYIDAKTEKGPEPTTGVSIKEISLTTSEYDVAYDGTTGNMLIGTDVDIPVPDDSYLYYILSYGTVTKRLGFYKWPEGNTLSAHKAYVQQSPSSPARALIFHFEDDVTGINDAITDFKADNYNEAIYNLNGIRLSKPQKGINIINGKKIWVK